MNYQCHLFFTFPPLSIPLLPSLPPLSLPLLPLPPSPPHTQVVVVGNPANTNAMICSHFAPSIPKENFTCLTRLDQNRAQAQVSESKWNNVSSTNWTDLFLPRVQISARVGVRADAVRNVIIWGNHSSTQFPDVSHAYVLRDGQKTSVYDAVQNDEWIKEDFIKVRLEHC